MSCTSKTRLQDYFLDFSHENSANVFLADERVSVTKKTFTRWVNAHLSKVCGTLHFLSFEYCSWKKRQVL